MDCKPNELIQLVQFPIIEEQLHALKDLWEQRALDADAMVGTEETIQTIKSFRADMRKEFDEIEAARKQVKQAVMEPYNQFEAVYKDCITNAFRRADDTCVSKISRVENDMKQRCEDGLRDYFAELCSVRHLDWLEYERAGVKVDMASAKAKTPKKLREQLASFVTRVGDSVDHIIEMEDADDIMVEFRRTLDATDAIYTVQERHRRIEAAQAEREARYKALEAEEKAVRKVEALAQPVQQVEQPKQAENTIKVSLVLYPTKAQFEEKIRPILRQLKQICDMEGIEYE